MYNNQLWFFDLISIHSVSLIQASLFPFFQLLGLSLHLAKSNLTASQTKWTRTGSQIFCALLWLLPRALHVCLYSLPCFTYTQIYKTHASKSCAHYHAEDKHGQPCRWLAPGQRFLCICMFACLFVRRCNEVCWQSTRLCTFFPPGVDDRAGDSLQKPRTSEQISFTHEG